MTSYQCLNCLQPSTLIHVHGHYQCSKCGMNILPCCDGDNCNTNWLSEGAAETKERSVKVQTGFNPLLSGKKDSF